MTDRRPAALDRLVVGDIVDVESMNGGRIVCVITARTVSTIITRRLLVQEEYVFSASTGQSDVSGSVAKIASIAPLPNDIYTTLIGLDRRHRLSYREEDARLTQDEKKALSFIYDFYRDNPIPGFDNQDVQVVSDEGE